MFAHIQLDPYYFSKTISAATLYSIIIWLIFHYMYISQCNTTYALVMLLRKNATTIIVYICQSIDQWNSWKRNTSLFSDKSKFNLKSNQPSAPYIILSFQTDKNKIFFAKANKYSYPIWLHVTSVYKLLMIIFKKFLFELVSIVVYFMAYFQISILKNCSSKG